MSKIQFLCAFIGLCSIKTIFTGNKKSLVLIQVSSRKLYALGLKSLGLDPDNPGFEMKICHLSSLSDLRKTTF